MKKASLILSGILLAASNISFAQEGRSNNCEKFSVSFTNSTSEICTLINYSLNHGYFKYSSSVPAFIPAGSTTHPIFLKQSWYGPDLEVAYMCGKDKMIRVRSKQNLCFLQAGNVRGEVLSARTLKAEYNSNEGSFFWSQHGSIHWHIYG